MAFGTVKVDTITTSTKTVTVDDLTANGLTSSAIGSTVQAFDADTAKTDVAQTYTAGQRGTITTLTSASTVTPDFGASNHFSLTIGQKLTFANHQTQRQDNRVYFPDSDGYRLTHHSMGQLLRLGWWHTANVKHSG